MELVDSRLAVVKFREIFCLYNAFCHSYIPSFRFAKAQNSMKMFAPGVFFVWFGIYYEACSLILPLLSLKFALIFGEKGS